MICNSRCGLPLSLSVHAFTFTRSRPTSRSLRDAALARTRSGPGARSASHALGALATPFSLSPSRYFLCLCLPFLFVFPFSSFHSFRVTLHPPPPIPLPFLPAPILLARRRNGQQPHRHQLAARTSIFQACSQTGHRQGPHPRPPTPPPQLLATSGIPIAGEGEGHQAAPRSVTTFCYIYALSHSYTYSFLHQFYAFGEIANTRH